VPFLRPPHLASDETPMLDVLVDLLASLAVREQYRPDVVVLLQPTSPLRRAEHIDAAVRLLTDSGADAVVSVVAIPHRFSPPSLLRLDGDRLFPWMDGPQPARRQEKPRLFARNGPAVLAVRTAVVAEQRALYGADTRGLVMSDEESLDVDSYFDLKVAELLMASRTR
jgi:CMP-N-acetylneuraminic acid synthetase